MNKPNPRRRASLLATLLILAAGPFALADPPAGPRVAPADGQQAAPPADGGAGDPSPLPKAGASESKAAGPGVGASRNPFRPHTSEMLRQSNRLKAKGFVGIVMNDGELTIALDSAKRLMGKAELETRGHRTKATQQIDLAIKLLNTKAAKSVANSRVPIKAVKEAKTPLTRAESDEFLRAAGKSLAKTLAHMNSDGNARRHAPARAAVQKAIEELGFALEGH